MPLDYMLSVMRDAGADTRRRDAMAMAAAPYLHPKVTAVEARQVVETDPITSLTVRFVRPRANA